MMLKAVVALALKTGIEHEPGSAIDRMRTRSNARGVKVKLALRLSAKSWRHRLRIPLAR